MAKYNTYIELSPHYESVVDIDSESRHPDMWQEYIVHEDMKGAIEKICDSMKYEDEDKRRSFWIHGAYGTGKSYAAIVLKHLFEDKVDSIRKFLSNQTYALYEEYGSVDDFREEVNAGNLKAANVVARIYRDKGWGFFTSLQMFKDWVADVIEGNNLQDTGIIFIWDEFTSYLRNNPTDDVLQPLSEFCKEQPFFMFLIVHRAPSWVSQIGEEVYEQIVHRYHSLDFHVSESAAYELIGSSILTRAGMEEQWNAEKDMDNYQHFSVSGNAAGGNTDEHDVVGEIHGGNTAEERLVSVIVIKRKQPLPPVTCKPKGGLFVTKKNGHVEKALQFSRPISTLEVSYDNKEATCTMNADGSWLVILDGVTTDDITLSVIANGRLLPNVTLKVKAQGISKNDDPFGGIGL